MYNLVVGRTSEISLTDFLEKIWKLFAGGRELEKVRLVGLHRMLKLQIVWSFKRGSRSGRGEEADLSATLRSDLICRGLFVVRI